MDISDDNLQTLANYLVQTLSPERDVRKPAEKFLESVEINKGYPLLLLNLINKQDVHQTIRVAGAISFKNYVKRNWPIVDGDNKIDISDRNAIKETIVESMLTAHPSIQKQLSEAVGVIGRSDFPREWPNLLPDMVQRFASGDFHLINGVLQTGHSIFKRYRYEFKSQALWEEIKFVLDTFSKPLTDLALATQNLAQQHAGNAEALKTIYSSLLLIAKIFYSLNYQDLPEFFEDNMKIWMPLFHTLLVDDVKLLDTDDDNEAGLVVQLRSQICSNVTLYVQKYDEEFVPYLPGFVTDIWNLLVTVSLQPKNDILVSNALQFLSTVADRHQHRHLFEDKNVLTGICEKVVIPNIHFRDADLELFEDNPEEYIRRDIEGSDVESRRRSASDLVKVLSAAFPETVRLIFGASVQQMLSEYVSDGAKWQMKNAAVYIVTSLAERGATAKHGVTKASELVELPEFATLYILPELTKEVNVLPVIKADSIKFLLAFRSILPPQLLVASFPAVIKHLHSSSQVVHSYAASAVDKLLMLRQNGHLVMNEAMLAPMGAELLNGLFHVLTLPGSEENEYAMKAIMRTFNVLNESVIPYLSNLLPKLTEKLGIIAKNPSKPHFNHYLFEALSISIRIVCKKSPEAVSAFEDTLFPIFQIIFQQDVQEFAPYCMQVLSLMLGTRPTSSGLPPPYVALYPSLLTPQLWERTGCIRGLVCLLQAYVRVASAQDYNTLIKVSGLLGIFQKLIASRLNDHEGFNLIETLIVACPRELLWDYMKQVVLLLFQRLTSSKTVKFTKCLIVFFSLLIAKYGALTFIDLVDSVQAQMFGMVVERLLVPDCRKVTENSERKIVAVALARLLSDTKQVFGGPYSALWPTIAKTLVEFLEAPVDDTEGNEGEIVEVEDLPGYDAAYVHLSALGSAVTDLLPEVGDARDEVTLQLKQLYSAGGASFGQAIASLGDPHSSALRQYLLRAGIQI